MLLVLCGCSAMGTPPLPPSPGHITAEPEVAGAEIPALVEEAPVVPEPGPAATQERYTVVVNEVPVKELLFALARDAEINVDIHPAVDGIVTINAVDQTLPQILNRITRQVDLRYEFDDGNLIISPDTPFVRSYNVGYLNLSRETLGTVTVSTQIASASSGAAGEGGGSGSGRVDGGGVVSMTRGRGRSRGSSVCSSFSLISPLRRSRGGASLPGILSKG